jgi:hypothetical protein
VPYVGAERTANFEKVTMGASIDTNPIHRRLAMLKFSATWVFLAGFGTVATGLDLASYRVERVKNESVSEYVPFECMEWQNFLTFSNSDFRIPLARSSATRVTADHFEQEGFDPGSLRLCWLDEDRLLWVSWTTFSRGSGGCRYDGHLILLIQGDQPRELFRDYFNSVARGGWASGDYETLGCRLRKGKTADYALQTSHRHLWRGGASQRSEASPVRNHLHK